MVGFRDPSESLKTCIYVQTHVHFSQEKLCCFHQILHGVIHKQERTSSLALGRGVQFQPAQGSRPGVYHLPVIVIFTCSPWWGIQGHQPWQQQCTVSCTLPALYFGPARNSHLNSEPRCWLFLRFLIKVAFEAYLS